MPDRSLLTLSGANYLSVFLQKEGKYDPELEVQIRDWINQVLGGQVVKPEADQKDFHETLKSGEILLKYVKMIDIKMQQSQAELWPTWNRRIFV